MTAPAASPPGRARSWVRLAPILLAAVVAIAAALLPRVVAVAGAAEEAIADLRVAALGTRAPTQHLGVALVAITEETLAALPYRSPVDRGLLAAAVMALGQTGVKAVGIDILVDRPTETEKDAALAQAIAESPVPVVLAHAGRADGLDEAQAGFLDAFMAASRALPGHPVLARDADGTVRRWAPAGDRPGFVAALAPIAGVAVLRPGVRIDYLGAPLDGTDTFVTLPAHTLPLLATAQPHALAAAFKDKIVLIGADLPGIDRHRTPLAARAGAEPDMAGVAIHAQMLAQALDGRRMREAGVVAELALAFALALAGTALAHGDRPGWRKMAAVLGVAGALWVAGFALVAEARILVPLAMPTLALFGAYGLESGRVHRKERALRRFIRHAFTLFVPPAVVDEMVKDPARLALGGERREITVLFTDVEGFTTLAERTPPQDLVPLLNAYLDGVSKTVLDHGGTLDKFVGDAVVAFFNAPLPQPDHAARAVACALAIDRFAEAFRAGHPGFGRTRIGVHTGPAVVGNFGGERRFDYTAMGDTVNTAARLESANKHLGTRVCVSAVTARACPHDMLRPAGEVMLKGKTEAVGVFEPAEGDADWRARYGEAYAALAAGEPRALAAFQALAAERSDALVTFHLDRLAGGARDARIVLEEK